MNVTALHDERDEVISSPLFVRARRNIETKLAILRSWISDDTLPWLCNDQGEPIRDTDGELTLDYYPKNLAQFAAWDATQNCSFGQARIHDFIERKEFRRIRSFGRKTLYQNYHSDLNAQVRATLQSIESLAEKQLLKHNKTNQINSLSAELKYYKDLRKQQDTEIAQFRNILREFEGKERLEAVKREEGEREYQRIIEGLKEENSVLVRTLSKLSPMHIPKP